MVYNVYCKGRKATTKTLRGARAKGYDMFYLDGGLRGGRIAMIYNENRYVGALMEFYSIGPSNRYTDYLVWYSNGKLYSADSSGDLWGSYTGKTDRNWIIELIKDHRKQFLSQRK